MAVATYPLWVTNDDNVPALPLETGSINTFTQTGQSAKTFGGSKSTFGGSFYVENARSPTLPLILTVPAAGDFNTADIDVLLQYRQLAPCSNEYPVGVIVRASQSQADHAVNGYGLFAGGRTNNYRACIVAPIDAVAASQGIGTGTLISQFLPAEPQAYTPFSMIRYLRLRIAGNVLTGNYYTSATNGIQQRKTITWTDTANTYSDAAGVGFLVRPGSTGIFSFSLLSIANGSDNTTSQVTNRFVRGTVYQPEVPGSADIPAANYPVRAYHRDSGTLLDSSVSAASGAYILRVPTGADEVTANAVDTDGNVDRWGYAIKGPVTPGV